MMEAIFPPLPLPIKEVRYVRNCVDSVIKLLTVHGFSTLGFERKSTYDHWVYCAAVAGSGIKFVKYKLVAFFNAGKMELTKEKIDMPLDITLGWDKPNLLLCSRGYRFLRLLLRKSPSEFDSVLTGIQYSKRGMPRPDRDLVRKSEQEAFVLLTTAPTPLPPVNLLPWGDIPAGNPNLDCDVNTSSFTRQLIRTVRELFTNVDFKDSDRVKPFFPSTSANYINNRAFGGAVGLIMEHPSIMNGLRTDSDLVTVSYLDVPSQRLADLGSLSRLPDDIIRHIYSFNGSNLPVKSRRVFPLVDDSRLNFHFAELFHNITREAVLEPKIAVPLGLSESLKVRVISKGPPFTYTALKPLQRKMWSTLFAHPTFKLVGTPVTGPIIQERLGAKLQTDRKFLSVDYSDATNRLHSWVSDVVVKEIASLVKLSQVETDLFIEAMTKHIVQDPHLDKIQLRQLDKKLLEMKRSFEWNYNDPEVSLADVYTDYAKLHLSDFVKPQLRGQLMGSIVSFPILCIINATIMRWSYEISVKQQCLIRDCPFLINGDDAVIKINDYGRLAWEKIATFVGLDPSPGKVYYSSHFLNMNSTNYNFDPIGEVYNLETPRGVIQRRSHFTNVKYVNLGLLFGLKRSGVQVSASEETQESNFSSRANDLLKFAPEHLHHSCLCQYIHENSKKLKQFNVPWFIPRHLGGLGLPIVGDYKPSDKDLRLARKIYDHPKEFKVPGLPNDAPWVVWNQVQKLAPFRNLVSQDLVGQLSYNDLYGRLCVQLLFTTTFQHLYKDVSDTEGVETRNYFRRLTRLWKKALLSNIPLPEPFNILNFPREYKLTQQPVLFIKDPFELYEKPTVHELLSVGYYGKTSLST